MSEPEAAPARRVAVSEIEVDAALMRRYDRPGPRYTSYPTAVEFDDAYDAAEYRSRLRAADELGDEPLSLYVHLPFCRERCAYCGCNVVIARRHEIVSRYLGYLQREIDLLADALPQRRRVSQLHWGGGTPTYLTAAELEELYARIAGRFDVARDAEVAIELDPRVTGLEQLEALRGAGFNRVSLGVQDFTEDVQAAIERHQTGRQTRELMQSCRDLGFESVNVDLVYGLPRQTTVTFTESMRQVLDLRPDRVAVYSYAHVPRVVAHQRRIDEAELPDPEVKLQLFLIARRMMLEAGYAAIGMDHFALPEDELVTAQREGTLSRNFMGYTVRSGTDALGLGVSAIGDVRGSFAQNEKKLSRYYAALDEGHFPIARGRILDRDDLIRREVIRELMCNFRLDRQVLERATGIEFGEYFRRELDELAAPGGPVDDGLIEVRADRLEVVGLGRLFVRNLCMTFDRHLRERGSSSTSFSRTV
ncbi:MAG: oxygen-independent coproporphyrinogen III oxidase [bacterium]|nr:oxygen-independent coproporphyrinogen III oxidase [bacterium]